MSTLLQETRVVASRCWKKDPSTCRIHGANSASNALAKLTQAKEQLNNVTNQDEYDSVMDDIKRAQANYDVTPEGLDALEQELEQATTPLEKFLIEERIKYVKLCAEAEQAKAELEVATQNAVRNDLVFSGDMAEQLKTIQQTLEEGVAAFANSDEWKKYLESASKFHNYSFNNQMLIMLQTNGEATQVASYKSWNKDHGRTILKGSKAIKILAPITYTKKVKDPETGEEKEDKRIGYKAVPVFDISQTEGKEVPKNPTRLLEGEAPKGMVETLESSIKEKGFTVTYEEISGGANGYTTRVGNRVVIDSRLSPAQRAKTLAHERAHIELGHLERDDYHMGPGGCRGEMEMEAESTAFIVSHAKGLNSGDYSFGYITGWSGGDVNKLKTLGATVSKAAKAILDGSSA